MGKRQYTGKQKNARRSAAGWVVLVLLCLVAAGIVWLRGTVDRDDRQPEENTVETASAVQATEEPVMPGTGSAAVKEDKPVVPAAAGSSSTVTQAVTSTPSPKNEPPIWFPSSRQEEESGDEAAESSSDTQVSSAAASAPVPSTPVSTPAAAPTPTPVQNSTPSGEVQITLEENELPLF